MCPHRRPSFDLSVTRSTQVETAQHGLSKQVLHGRCVRLFGIAMWPGPGLGTDELTTIA